MSELNFTDLKVISDKLSYGIDKTKKALTICLISCVVGLITPPELWNIVGFFRQERHRVDKMEATIFQELGILKSISYTILILGVVGLIYYYTYVHFFKKDLKYKIKIGGHLKVKKLDSLNKQIAKNLNGLNTIILFEANEHNLKKHLFDNKKNPQFLKASEVILEKAKYSGTVLKFEPFQETINTYSVPNEDIKLSLIEYEEPNYGRELYVVKVEDKGIDITKRLDPNCNRIHFQLNKFEFNKPGTKFCYFPFESGGVLYNLKSSLVLKLNYKPKLNAQMKFIGNKFSTNQLAVVYDRLLLMVNLTSLKIENFEIETDERYEWIDFLDENTIEVTISKLKTAGSILNTIGSRKTLYNNGYN